MRQVDRDRGKVGLLGGSRTGGNPDYTLRILPKANHLQLEAKIGSNAEMASPARTAASTPRPSKSGSPNGSEGFGGPITGTAKDR